MCRYLLTAQKLMRRLLLQQCRLLPQIAPSLVDLGTTVLFTLQGLWRLLYILSKTDRSEVRRLTARQWQFVSLGDRWGPVSLDCCLKLFFNHQTLNFLKNPAQLHLFSFEFYHGLRIQRLTWIRLMTPQCQIPLLGVNLNLRSVCL